MRVIRGLTSYVLECGCLVGVYETYTGQIVDSVDALGSTCDRHRKHDHLDPSSRPPSRDSSRSPAAA